MGITFHPRTSAPSHHNLALDTDSVHSIRFITTMGDSIKDLVVLVTGASSGMGRGCAVEFARWGAKLALHGRDAERLQITADRCMEAGLSKKNIFMITGDVTVEEDVDRIMSGTVAHYGHLDVLLNNAGATRARNIDTCTIDDLDWCYNVLVRSVFMMSKAAIPHLEKTKGAILNMSSLSGLRPLHYAVPYSMCKNMVDHFSKILSVALGPRGIRCNNVNPATVMTEMFDKENGIPGGHKYIDWSNKVIPVGRCGEIAEVARLVVFLASKDANFMSGVQFPIDGAYSLTSYHKVATKE